MAADPARLLLGVWYNISDLSDAIGVAITNAEQRTCAVCLTGRGKRKMHNSGRIESARVEEHWQTSNEGGLREGQYLICRFICQRS